MKVSIKCPLLYESIKKLLSLLKNDLCVSIINNWTFYNFLNHFIYSYPPNSFFIKTNTKKMKHCNSLDEVRLRARLMYTALILVSFFSIEIKISHVKFIKCHLISFVDEKNTEHKLASLHFYLDKILSDS